MTQKSRITCGRAKHVVTFSDGAVTSDGCELNGEHMLATANMVRLGGKLPPNSCIALAVLVLYGLDDTVGRGALTIADMGVWTDIYLRWQSNRVVEKKVASIVKQSPAHRARRKAMQILRRAPVFKRMLEVDFNSSVEFQLEVDYLPDRIEGSADSFVMVPLQKGWIGNVFADPECGALHDLGVLVLGKNEEQRKVCLVLDRAGNPSLELR